MKVLYIAPEFPNRGENAAQVRANAVLGRLRGQVDLKILAFPPHGGSPGAAEAGVVPVERQALGPLGLALATLSPRPRACRRFAGPAARRALAQTLRSFRPDVVHFDTVGTLGLLGPVLAAEPRPRIVVQTHDAVSRLYANLAAEAAGLRRLDRRIEGGKVRRLEASLLARADLVLVDSDEDAAILRAANPANRVATLPLGFDEAQFSPGGPGAGLEQPALVFTGSFGSRQSADAADWLVRQIMPLVRARRPDAHLYLVGANPSPAVRALAGERVHVTGFVDDLGAHLRDAALYVCPLRLGSGMRTRVVEALACGAATVATPEAVRGLAAAEAGAPAWITAEGTGDFADAVVDGLAADRAPLKAAAAAYARKHYSWDGIVRRLVSLYGEAARPGPVFVVGNPRSGTTLARLVIASHPAVSIPPESDFIVRLFPRYGQIRRFSVPEAEAFLADLGGGVVDLAEQWEVPLAALADGPDALAGLSYADACALLYRAYPAAKGLPPAAVWGDKNNAHGNYIDVLAGLYPDARFVHVVRDGRAVLNSYKALDVDPGQRYAPLLPKRTAEVAARWTDMVGRIERHLARHARGRHITVRYEDILTDFERTIGGLCSFLGLHYDPAMARFHEFNIRHKLEPERYSWKENTRKPLDAGRADAWRETLAPEDAQAFEALALATLRRHGYPLDAATRPAAGSLAYPLKSRLREYLRAGRKARVDIRRAMRREAP